MDLMDGPARRQSYVRILAPNKISQQGDKRHASGRDKARPVHRHAVACDDKNGRLHDEEKCNSGQGGRGCPTTRRPPASLKDWRRAQPALAASPSERDRSNRLRHLPVRWRLSTFSVDHPPWYSPDGTLDLPTGWVGSGVLLIVRKAKKPANAASPKTSAGWRRVKFEADRKSSSTD